MPIIHTITNDKNKPFFIKNTKWANNFKQLQPITYRPCPTNRDDRKRIRCRALPGNGF